MAKIGPQGPVVRRQLSQLPMAGRSTSEVLPKPPTSTQASLDGGNDSARKGGSRGGNASIYVPVVSATGKPLMPCHPARARELIRKGRAARSFRRGIFYILLLDRGEGETQAIACGIDPGSKKEGFTVKSEAHTFLNIQADAVTHVKKVVEVRRNMRRTRRFRKTPCRADRQNRSRGGIPHSTKARWGWKLRIVEQLVKLYPITDFVVEDIKAKTTGRRRWDKSFSPLQVGKQWFYAELAKLGDVHLKQGWETAELRVDAGLKKTSKKMAEVFEAHCVDSWVLANWCVGGHVVPDNKRILCVSSLQFHRRRLHALQPAAGGVRRRDGGTRSCGFKRGALVEHSKYGLAYIGGTAAGKVSLHSLVGGKRLCQNAKPTEVKVRAYNTWRTHASM